MNPKKIENLNPATTLQDDDLLFASVRQGGAIYASKKVTLKDIADYVRNGTVVVPGGSESGFGGYEMIDTTDSNNYLWSYEVGSANGNSNTRLEKQVSKDCLVWLAYYSSTAINVKIDGVPLKMEFFGGFNGSGWTYSSGYRFYIKSGQTLTVEHNDSDHNIQVFIIPLKSGGKFFFDTSKQDKFIYGELDVNVVNSQPVVQNTSTNTNIFPGQDYVDNPNNNRPKITVDCPTLFSYRYASNTTNPAKLNGKSVVSDDIDRGFASGNAGDSDPKPFICLDAGDTFEPAIEPEASSVVEWIAYPLLVNESEHGSGSSEDKSCGYVQYDMEETDNPDFGSYEDNEELNYIQGLTIGSGSADLPKLEKTFSKDCEVLLRFSPELESTKNSKSHVKIGNITIPTMLAFGEYGLYDMKLYVKKGQTLNVDPQNSMKITVFVNPLKSGGEFFIDGNADLESIYDLELTNNFESYNFYSNGPFEFTAPQKTLFIYRGGTDTINTWQNNVTINGMKVPIRRHLCSYVTTDSSGNPVVNYCVYLWNRFILEERDKLKFNITSSNGSIFMHYNILPLLEN